MQAWTGAKASLAKAGGAIGVSQRKYPACSKSISAKAFADQLIHVRRSGRCDESRSESRRSAGKTWFSVFIHVDAPVGRTIVLKNLSIAAISAIMIVSFKHSAFGTSIGVGNPYPVSHYECQDGTRLAVRLLGDRASVSVNDAAEVDLPSKGPEGTTYSNGQWTLTIIQGRLSWGVGRAVPSLCAGG
ncbi:MULTISPECIES: hypothetical protein [unclassified Mesorhizobium]|uniref:hypothetical protein n=1 Tax=unclassified Mesorhizobium TaxID=325217 RepID=UPI001CCF873F|nr:MULTISPECIES: hypothetical protein [unclassified Mesorhizobium]MBZ9895663.1 hypothetical protein [Mesorhizobium sp. BR1-1-6]MBZ9959584.1 hypothetical protein [Mesorhizobium sp. BR1-1-14]MCA0000149.1 hypothetical protein [Mesorhizobium sp. B264B2A]MCA0006200.1 hypothetical protein [Mesorhizobium sp. B264B1B]MCA0017791.1 hypothetical protein [Mesorhizobium sp. B264B1A]